jgi:hypothetical protein
VIFRPVLLLFAALPASAQMLSIGAKAGVPLTDAFSTSRSTAASATSYNRPYIIGPTVEVHLPLRLSFEADALYRRNGVTLQFFGPNPAGGFIQGSSKIAVNDWQFPLLGKYELLPGPVRPFVDAGLVYRHVSSSSTFKPDNSSSAGFAMGGGLTLKLSSLRLSPEIRYTHWPTRPFSNGNLVFLSSQNQADFLVGLTF